MLNGSAIIVIVPAFREEAHVGDVVRTMPAFVDRILVVDDASDDRTGEKARGARVTVIRHASRRGVGAAITTGYRAALAMTTNDTDALVVMAGDGQIHPDDLEHVVSPIVRGRADYVKGDRFGDPHVRSRMGLPRWIGGQVFTRRAA